MKSLKPLAAFVLAIVLAAASVEAQSDRGTIRGTVVDPNGAVIANAKVSVAGIENGEVRDTVTGDEGIYVFPELKAGIYRVMVEAPGFSRTTVDNVKVDVQGIQTLEVKLQIGEVTGEVVTVQGEGVAINSDTPVRQTNVTERQVKELPLIVTSESGGRTPLSFIFLDSNVGTTDQSGSNNSSNFRVSGGQGAGVEILIDGASTRRTQNGNFFTEVAPGPNAYQEFTISTNSYSAEFGNSSGGIVNFTLKSGGNEYHGEAYDIIQNEVFNANNVYSKVNGLERDRDNQNNYGFNIGGPIGFPGFGEGTKPFYLLKDRAFFFFNYEGYKFIRGANRLTTVPTVRMRNGDFSEYLTDPYVLGGFPNGIRIYDPRPGFNRAQFAGNIIPQSAFDPAGFNILQYFPLPNRPGVHNNYASEVVVPNESKQITFKTDFVLTSKQRLTFSYSWKDNVRVAGGIPTLPLPFVEAFSAWNQAFNSKIARLQHDYTISANLINHLNVGYTYYDVGNLNTTYGFDTSSLGIPQNATPNLAFPLIDFVGDSNNSNSPRYSVDIGGVDFTDRLRDGALEVSDFVTWIRGRHTFKFGASVRNAQFNVQQTLHPGGRFGFHENQTGSDADPNPSGSAIASLLTGATEWSFTENNSFDPAFRQLTQSYFVQDDFKVTQKLTLNIGLRYDLPGQRTEAGNRYRSFDPDAINPITGTLGAIAGAGGQGGVTAEFESLAPPDHSNIGPRFGAAYAIDGKTVIRGGIGYYFAPILYGLNGGGTIKGGTIGYNVDTRWEQNARTPPPDSFLSNFHPLTPVDPNSQYVADIQADRGVAIPYFDKNFKTGRTLQYTIDLQRELPYRLVASIGYIGHKADRLRSNFGRINAIPLDALKLGNEILRTNINQVTPLQRSYAQSVGVTIPIASAVYEGFNGNVADALRPFPQYGTNIENFLESRGESSYNAVQLKLDRRFAQGFQFGASYTYSRLVTNASEDILGGGSALSGVLQNPFDTEALKTLSPTNPPQVFVVNFLAELPFGKGKRFLDSGGFVDAILGGWQVGGIFRYQQGAPLLFSFDPNYGGNFLSLAGYNGRLRPNLTGEEIGDVRECNTGVPAETGRYYYLNCLAFAPPPSFTGAPGFLLNGAINPGYASYYSDPLRFFGTAPIVNTEVRAPNYFSENLSILKKNRFGERFATEIGAEFFNVFNRVRYLTPDTNLGFPNGNGLFDNSNFGAVGATVEPRIIQLRVRVIF